MCIGKYLIIALIFYKTAWTADLGDYQPQYEALVKYIITEKVHGRNAIPEESEHIAANYYFDYQEPKDGYTILIVATEAGVTNLVEWLLSKANPNIQMQWGNTALHGAAEKGHIEIGKLLIDAGASLVLSTKDGQTPLDLARAHRNWAWVKEIESYLLEKIGFIPGQGSVNFIDSEFGSKQKNQSDN